MRRHHYPSFFFSCGLLALIASGCSGDGKGDDAGSDDAGSDDDDPNLDADSDGYPQADDCNDQDPDVYPGAPEDCRNDIDDNCDGLITECLDPTLIYEPLSPANNDPYGVGVFADYVIFGDPSGGTPSNIGDGRAVLFELEVGVVSELDAAVTSDGALDETGAYGIVVTPVGDDLCIGADYHDHGDETSAGKTWCFDETTVRSASALLELTDAAYSVEGEQDGGYSAMEAEVDVDGDGLDDLLVYTAVGMHVILGDGTAWSGDYSVPSDADLTLGDCTGSNSGWCGFGRAINPGAPVTLAISGEGGTPDTISLFSLPLVGGSTTATATAQIDRHTPDSATGIGLTSGSAFGNSQDGELQFLDGLGTVLGVLTGSGESSSLGSWSSTFFDQDDHELLLVSALSDAAPGSSGEGVVYVFDLTANGLPWSSDEARYVLVPPDGFSSCGQRARGGIVNDSEGSSTTVALSCPGSGGAAYTLDHRPPPPPPIDAQSVLMTAPNHYEIQQWVVDAYTSRLEWVLSLAQVEPVFSVSTIAGWRLLGIEPGSPLYRAGLRSGDVLREVNGLQITTPAVVQGLYQDLMSANELSLSITRDGVTHLLDYSIVP